MSCRLTAIRFSRFLLRGEMKDAVTYLVEHHKMLGSIEQERKRHRENAALDREIWESTAQFDTPWALPHPCRDCSIGGCTS